MFWNFIFVFSLSYLQVQIHFRVFSSRQLHPKSALQVGRFLKTRRAHENHKEMFQSFFQSSDFEVRILFTVY